MRTVRYLGLEPGSETVLLRSAVNSQAVDKLSGCRTVVRLCRSSYIIGSCALMNTSTAVDLNPLKFLQETHE